VCTSIVDTLPRTNRSRDCVTREDAAQRDVSRALLHLLRDDPYMSAFAADALDICSLPRPAQPPFTITSSALLRESREFATTLRSITELSQACGRRTIESNRWKDLPSRETVRAHSTFLRAPQWAKLSRACFMPPASLDLSHRLSQRSRSWTSSGTGRRGSERESVRQSQRSGLGSMCADLGRVPGDDATLSQA
jgi:hypothetical protein